MNNYHKKTTSLLSVIVPCRNEEKYIGRCLDSIVAQDYPEDKLEVLVIDGMSEDSRRGIVEKAVDRCIVVRNPAKKINSIDKLPYTFRS